MTSKERMTLGALIKLGGGLISTLALLAGMFVFLDDRYVNEDMYAAQMETTARELQDIEEKTVELIGTIEEEREKTNNEMLKAIKDASALPLIVQRDILLARGELTPAEQAELNVLRTKLRELNIE